MNANTLDSMWARLDAPGGVAWVGAGMALLLAEADAAETPQAAADLLCDAAALASARADGAERAPALYEEAQVRAPGHPPSAEGLALAAEAVGDLRQAARWCEVGLEGGAAGATRLRLLVQLIRAAQDHGVEASRPVLALVKEALVLSPADPALLARLALAGDDAANDPEALDARIAETGSLPHRARLLMARAAQRRETGDTAGARGDLEAALAADPSLTSARDGLTQILAGEGDHAALVAHLEGAAAALPAGLARGRVRYVAAMYADGPLGDRGRAEALFRAAAQDVRGDVAAARELARQGVDASEALGAWRRDPDPREAALGAWQVGRAAERAGDRVLAGEAYEQAASGGLRVARLARRRLLTGGAAAAVLAGQAAPDGLTGLLAEQAGWEALGAGDPAEARRHFEVAAGLLGVERVAAGLRAVGGTFPHEADPIDQWRAAVAGGDGANEAAALIESDASAPQALVAAAYDQADPRQTLKVAQAATGAQRARLALWAAWQAEALGDGAVGEEALRLAVEVADLRLAHIRLGRHLAARGDWAKVAALYDRQPGDGPGLRAALIRLAHGLPRAGDGDRVQAAPAAERWAAIEASLPGEVQQAVAWAEPADGAFAAGWVAGLAPSVQAARRALDANGGDPGLGWVLEALARPVGDAGAIEAALLAQGAAANTRRLLDGRSAAGAAEGAFGAWTEARLAVARGDLAAAQGHLSQLAEALGGTVDAPWVAQVAAALGTWDPTTTAAAQASAWERVLALHPDTPRGWDALLAARSEEPAGRAATLLRVARQASSEPEKAAALWEAALLERTRDPELAEELRAQAEVAWPTGALARLSRWGGWIGPKPQGTERVAAAIGLVGCVRSPALQAEVLGEAADVCADVLKQPADAARLSGLAAIRAPQSWALVETARSRLSAERAWAPLATVIERRLAAGPQEAERGELLHALAGIQLDGLRDRRAARATWQRIVAHEPDNAVAHRTLADLSFGLEDFPAAVEQYARAVALGLPDDEVARLELRVGRLKARHFKDIEGGLRHLRVARDLGAPGAAEAVAETLLTHGEAREAAAAYEALAATATDPVARAGARAGWVRALLVNGQRGLAQARLAAFREDDPADPLLLALEGELGPVAKSHDYRAVLDSVDLPEVEDGSDWGESLDLGPLGALEASASIAFEEGDLAIDPDVEEAAAGDLDEALAEVDALLAKDAGVGLQAARSGAQAPGQGASAPTDATAEPPDAFEGWGALEPTPSVAPAADAAVDAAAAHQPSAEPRVLGEGDELAEPADLGSLDGGDDLVLPEPTVVAAGGEGADFDFDGLAASQPGLEPDASPRGLDGAEPISTPPQRGAGLDEAWPRREKRPSTGTLSMGVVAVARPGRPDLLDLDDWDADEAVAELPSARPAADPRDAAPTRAGAPQPGPRSDGPISMGPLDDVSWPSLPALTPSPSPAQEASGAPLPPGPPSAGPPAPPAPDEKGPSLEDRLAFDEEVAPLAPTTGALPLVAGAEFADPLMMAVPLVAEGHDLEWLDPSVPPAQIPPTPPPLPALDSWDELAIEEADGPGALGEDAPLPSVELEWAELDLAPASVDAPLGTDGSWGDLDDPFEGDLGDDGAQPPSWPADISGVEPLDLEADDLGLATPRPPAPPSLPPAVVRPAVPTKGPSRADRAAEARIRIAREPLAPAGWLMLAEAETGDPAVTVWLNDVLAWLQGRVEPAPAAGEPSEPVPERLRRAMVPEGVPPNLLLLLRSVGPSVAPAFGPVKGRTPQGRRVPDHEPLAALVRRMCRILEVPPVQAVLNDARPYTVGAEAGEPSRIVLGTAVFDGSDASGASFLVARTLIPLREGTLPATVLSDREFRAFLAALFDMLDASFPVRSRDQPTMERIRGWLDPLLAVHQRLAWEPLAHAAVSGLGSRSAATVRVGLEQYSARLALALADGFGGAMEMLRLLDFDDRPRGQLTRAEVEQFLADNDAARDLLVFAASPACLDARRWLARSTGR